MAIKLTTYGQTSGLEGRSVVRVTRNHIAETASRVHHAFILDHQSTISGTDLKGYAAVLVDKTFGVGPFSYETPTIRVSCLEEFRPGHILTIEPKSGFIRTVYRPESPNNTLFATDRCNSNCLMCSQPPKDVDDSYLIKEHLRIISLIETPPQTLGITGGEPTLLGDHLITLLQTLKTTLPNTHIQMLTNGRLYKNADFPHKLASVSHPSFISAVPLYADVAGIHDYIVQAHGAFDETVDEIYNAAEAGLAVEIRIVLHKQSLPRLSQLTQFIASNFPFVVHVAFMGLEHMGYVKKNWEALWVDPIEYMSALEAAVQYLYWRGMNVSIYNLQLCLLPPSLWSFARQSISDYKNVYLDACAACSLKEHCSGFFLSQTNRYSSHIKPFIAPVMEA
jgi:His-Xaa-Ser system radical SAM maturase HxsC